MKKVTTFKPEDLTNREIRLSLRYAAELDLVYANNPKCACSTIKASIWRKIDDVNGTSSFHPSRVHSQAPFLNTAKLKTEDELNRFKAATTFSVVRNPFRRALSAYLDKVGSDRKDQRIWNWLCARYGLRSELTSTEFTFKDFLRLMLADDPIAIEPHFRPQYLNLFWHHLRWDEVARLEARDEMESFLNQRGMPVQTVDHHKTSSGQYVEEFFDPDAVMLAKDLYEPDFHYFGYARDHREVGPVEPARFVEGDGAIYDALGDRKPRPVAANDTPLSKFRKTAQRGKKLRIVLNHSDFNLDFNTACIFSDFVNEHIINNKTNVLPEKQLTELGKDLDQKKRTAHQAQFGHLNPAFFMHALSE